VFAGLLDLWTNTPNLKGPSRAQIAVFGDNYLLSDDPNQPNYFRFNFYHVQTDFEYVGLRTDLGHGWILDNKIYTYRYWNKQNYNNPSVQANGFFAPAAKSITATSAVDKLNGYRRVGDTTTVSHQDRYGILRAGLWFKWAYTDRYQIPSDPRTWVDAVLPNLHEHFITTSAQPFIEYEIPGTAATQRYRRNQGCGIQHRPQAIPRQRKDGRWSGRRALHISLRRVPLLDALSGSSLQAEAELDGLRTVRHRQQHSTQQRLRFERRSSGRPPEANSGEDISDRLGGEFNRWTLDMDAYYSHFQNPYSSFLDATGESFFFQTGPSNTKGVEAESNILLGRGVSLYLNSTVGSAKFQEGPHYGNGGLWIANAPKNTEAIGLTYQRKNWDLGIFNKRVGTMYNDNGTLNQAVTIQPFNVTNLCLNYTVRGESYLRGTKIRFGVTNLFDQHNIVGVVPFSAAGNQPAPGDIVTLLPGRSFNITMTFGYAPKW